MEVFSYLFCLGGGSSDEMLGHNYNLFEKWAVGAQIRERKPLGVLKLAHDYNIFQKWSSGTQIREKKAFGCPKVVREYICFP